MSVPKIRIRKFNPAILETRRMHGSPPTIIVLGKRGSGKSVSYGSKVMLYNGRFEEIQNIKVGQQLMGDDSTPRTVLATSNAYDDLYRVKQVSGDDYVVNGDHILSLKFNKAYAGGQVINGRHLYKGDIFDISVNDYLKLTKYGKEYLVGYKVPVVFPVQQVPLDPYLIGLWLGDGNSGDVGFTNQDAAILRYLAYKLPEYNCYLQFCGTEYRYRFQTLEKGISKNFVKQHLKGLNLINNKHVPDIYKYNSRENQLKLLAGLLDTDGSLGSNCFDFIQKNYTLAKDVEYICRCLGFTSKVVSCRKSCMYKGEKREDTYYRQTISGNVEAIPCLIARKQATPRRQIKNNLHTGIKVAPVEQAFYDQGPEYHRRYSIQIDGNQRFLLGDHTVTHNSTLISDLMWHMRKIPMFICMSGTEEGNGFYGKHVHPLLVHGEYKKDIVSNLIKQQRDKLKKCKKAGINHITRPDLDSGLLLDDCGFDKKIMNQEDMRLLFMNGRHFKICLIISLQYMMGLPPALRTNTDFVFCLRENIVANQKRLYDNYFGCFQKFSHFQEAFNECTNNYECLVLDNTSKSTKIEDCVYYYKATPNRDYKLGSKDLWAYLNSRYKDDDSDSDNDDRGKVQSSVVIKKAPMAHIVDNS